MTIISTTPMAASEGAGFIDFLVRLDAASLNEVKVNYQTDLATATYSGNQDFIFQQGTLTFAAGETSKTVRVLLGNDTAAEGTELFWLDLYSPTNAKVAARYTPAYIFDNDGAAGVPALSVGNPMVDEGGRTASFWVSLSRPAASPVTVNFSTGDGTAKVGEDFASAAGALSFAPGEMVKTVTVNLLDDASPEADETFRLLLSGPSGATLAQPVGVATIAGNDGPPTATPYVTAQKIAVSEGSTVANFLVQLSAPSTSEVSITYQADVGTATYGGNQDFIYVSDTLVFAPGETARLVTVPLSDGTAAEAVELFWLDLYNPVNALVPERWTPALVFDNDATSGTPGISVGDVVVDETAGTARFFVSLNRPSVSTVTVAYASADDTASAGTDFVASSGSLSFAPGEMVKTVVVDLADDGDAESDEFFKLVLSSPGNATLTDGTGVALIGRNDTDPVSTPQVLARPIVVGESETFASFVVQLSAPSQQEVKVTYQSDVGTATYGGNQDYIYRSDTLTFAPGQTTKVIQVPMSDGTVGEPAEIFWLDLYNPVNAQVPQRWTPALVVDNDGTSGTPALVVRDVAVDETAQTASFFVTLSRPSTSTVGVSYATAADTASAGADFAAVSGSLSFAPGEVAKTVVVNLVDDGDAETDEFFNLVLSAPANATLGDAVGTATIGRNDTAPVSTPYIVATPVAVGEGEVSTRVLVQLTAPSTTPVTVTYQTDVGTATYGGNQDYIYQSGTLVFAPGETTRTVEVLLSDGTVAEGTEAFWFDLYNPQNAQVSSRYTAGLIIDNDGASGTPAISVGDAVVDEAAQTARLFVSLSRPSTSTVTVAYASADDTAVAGSDYAAVAGTLSFAPGEVVKTVVVNLVDDSLAETLESFQLRLSNPSGGTLSDAVGAVVVGASDTRTVATPQIVCTPVSVSEGDTFATFVVQLNAPSVNEVRVNYQSDIGTATYSGNQDYIYQTGTVYFAPGETVKTVQVLLGNDALAESLEGFTLDLYSPVNATVPQRLTTANITDNDNPGAVYSYGLGNDQYTVTSALDKVVESPGGGIDTVRTGISITLPDNVENLVLTGAAAINALGNAGNNTFKGTVAANTFDGKEGVDTVVFSGPAAAYTVNGGVASRTVTSVAEGSDTLFSIERLQFSDVVRAADTSPGGNVYATYAMINAAFDRAPSTDELSMWTAQLDRLGSTAALAQAMINFYAPGVPDEVLVAHLWSTIVETPIPLDALSTYVGLVANGTFTQASLLDFVSTYELNTVEIVGIVGQTLGMNPTYFPGPG